MNFGEIRAFIESLIYTYSLFLILVLILIACFFMFKYIVNKSIAESKVLGTTLKYQSSETDDKDAQHTKNVSQK